MKRRIMMSTLLTALLVTAFVGTACAVDVDGPPSVKAGDTITVTVSGEGAGLSGHITTSGLRVLQANGGFSTARDVLLLRDYGNMSAQYTCEVTASEGEMVTFEVSRVTVSDGRTDVRGASQSWAASVVAMETPAKTSAESSDSENARVPSQAGHSSSLTGLSRGSAVYAPADAPDQVPRTGDATLDLWTLGLICAACAAIAIIAGSKALSQK